VHAARVSGSVRRIAHGTDHGSVVMNRAHGAPVSRCAGEPVSRCEKQSVDVLTCGRADVWTWVMHAMPPVLQTPVCTSQRLSTSARQPVSTSTRPDAYRPTGSPAHRLTGPPTPGIS